MSDTNALRDRICEELNRNPTDILGGFFNPNLTVKRVVNREINAAIQHYESTRFRWNEVIEEESFIFSASSRNATLPIRLVRLDSIKVISSGAYVPLRRRSWEHIEQSDRSTTGNTGVPAEYALYGNVIRPNPQADTSYTAVLSYVRRYNPTSLTGSYTALVVMGGRSLTVTTTASHNNRLDGWTTDGRELIAARACAAVKINYFRDPDATAEQNAVGERGAQMDQVKMQIMAQRQEAIAEQANLGAKGESFLSYRERAAYQSLIDETTDFTTTGLTKPYSV